MPVDPNTGWDGVGAYERFSLKYADHQKRHLPENSDSSAETVFEENSYVLRSLKRCKLIVDSENFSSRSKYSFRELYPIETRCERSYTDQTCVDSQISSSSSIKYVLNTDYDFCKKSNVQSYHNLEIDPECDHFTQREGQHRTSTNLTTSDSVFLTFQNSHNTFSPEPEISASNTIFDTQFKFPDDTDAERDDEDDQLSSDRESFPQNLIATCSEATGHENHSVGSCNSDKPKDGLGVIERPYVDDSYVTTLYHQEHVDTQSRSGEESKLESLGLHSIHASKNKLSPIQQASKTTNKLVPEELPESKTTRKPALNTLSCPERKQIFISPSRPLALTSAMEDWSQKTQLLLDPFRFKRDCWFHPQPPPPKHTASGIHPTGKISRTFTWYSSSNIRHTLNLNYGICIKLLHHELTKKQTDGWVHRQWHLSHLCGNWSCVNPRHTTVEPGSVNIQRNKCFAHRDGCTHEPSCMKELKVALGVDGKLVPRGDGVEQRIREAYHWKDWWCWDGPGGELEKIKRECGGVELESWDDVVGGMDDDDDEHSFEDEDNYELTATYFGQITERDGFN